MSDSQLRLLTVQDTQAVLALRETVLSRLEHPDLYVREDDEMGFVRRHLAGHAGADGETIGVYDGEELIAYAMLGLPRDDDPEHLGRYLQLAPRAPGEVSHLASCMVHPAHRGHGLQRTLLGARFTLAQAQGRPLCIAMVSPHNHASRQNLLREGLRIVYVGAVTGLKRHLVAIDLARPWRFDEAGATTTRNASSRARAGRAFPRSRDRAPTCWCSRARCEVNRAPGNAPRRR